MVRTAIWDAQNGQIQIWRKRRELTYKNDQFHVWFGQPSGMPRMAIPDLADKRRADKNDQFHVWFGHPSARRV